MNIESFYQYFMNMENFYEIIKKRVDKESK